MTLPPAIRQIRVSNFKSFGDLQVDLPRFGVLIGANASGKSNFVQIFEFLRDLAQQGLDNAISLQGGIEFLRNMRIGSSSPLSLQLIFENDIAVTSDSLRPEYIRIVSTAYEIRVDFAKRGSRYKTITEKLIFDCELRRISGSEPDRDSDELLQEGKLRIEQTNGRVHTDLGALPERFAELSRFPRFVPKDFSGEVLLIHHPLLHLPWRFPVDIGIYDFDPRLPKRAVPITGKSVLERDGSNLAIVLKHIAEDSTRKERLLKFVRTILPFVDDIRTERFVDKSVILSLREQFHGNRFLPATLISDGTISIVALVIALYIERSPVVIFEEPERNLHPALLAQVVQMMKDASETKQVIVTTHNPEFVKHAGIEHLLLVSRDEDGFSVITRPKDREDVRIFLEHDIGVEDLYVQELLGA